MKAFLEVFIPRYWPEHQGCWTIHSYESKDKLIKKLPERLSNLQKLAFHGMSRILVLVDRDDDDCRILADKLEEIAKRANLVSRRQAEGAHISNCIVIEELESWFFGDVDALVSAYPRIPSSLGEREAFRDPDAISGGTCEKLHQVLKEENYYRRSEKLPKCSVATNVAQYIDPTRNRSASFQYFWRTLSTMMPAPPEES